MLVLGIDTSDGVSVALLEGADVLAHAEGADPRRHAETLAPAIAWVLKEAGAQAADLAAVAAGTGPAPFTGLRVGLVTARTLARTLRIPAHGICSLDALARQAFDVLDLPGAADVIAVTDARRREVYSARYRPSPSAPQGDVERIWEPSVGSAEELRARLEEGETAELVRGPAVAGPAPGAGAAIVGRGAQLYPDLLPVERKAPLTVDAAVLARLAQHRALHGGELDLEPRYLRRPDAMPAPSRKRAS